MSVRSAGVRLRRPTLGSLGEGRPQVDDVRALIGGTVAVGLIVFWSADNGGFGAGTWYWGALVALAALAAAVVLGRRCIATLPRSLKLALGLFALYVGWSYLSMTWASYPGLALEGSNRALLYLVLFALMAVLPWRRPTALLALLAYACGIGVIAVVFLMRFALGDQVPSLFLDGRLVAPTGYFNATAALFTIGALVATAIAARRRVPGVMRGLLVAFAAADLMLAVTVQSRGWLFTLPIVGVWSIVMVAGRLRTVGTALLPAAGTLVAVHPMLRLFQIAQPAVLTHAAVHAGKIGLLACAGVFAVGTLIAWIEQARGRPPLPALPRRALGTAAVLLALAGVAGGLWVVSGGHPGPFVSRQWHGFTSEPTDTATANHFVEVGSGRYDIWRSALEAFRAHPIGGLGQDNFGDWYLTHRHTTEEPLWTHSLELRLLAHTGIVGLLLFAGFVIAALVAAGVARRRGELPDRMLVGAALLPLGVWLIHGSIDWFWEIPALSGPALGFLALAGRVDLPPSQASERADAPRRRPARAVATAVTGIAAVGAATVVLGLPFLAITYLNRGEAASYHDVDASLADFHTAYRLDPLMSDPGTLAGTVALVNGRPRQAQTWFDQAVAREPGSWYGWLGASLAASARRDVTTARRDARTAARLDDDQPAVRDALRRVGSAHPLTIGEALDRINYLP